MEMRNEEQRLTAGSVRLPEKMRKCRGFLSALANFPWIFDRERETFFTFAFPCPRAGASSFVSIMKITVSSSTLYQRLQMLNHVVPTKTTIPMLQHVLFEVEGTRLRLTAYDEEIALFTIIDLDASEEDGRVAIRPSYLLGLLREMGDQPVTLEVDMRSYRAQFTYQNGHSNFTAVEAQAYPVPAAMEGDFRQGHLPAAQLLKGLNLTMFATSDDKSRPAMGGIHFDLADPELPGLTLVASDGHKLIRYHTDLASISDPVAFTLPKRPMKLLKDILAKETEEVDLRCNASSAEFRMQEYTLFCQLLNKPYPKYRSVIPSDNPYHALVDREALQSALRRIVVYADETSTLLRLRIGDNDLTVSAENLDYSISAEEHVRCDYNGAPMVIGFKGFFLIDILGTLSVQEVVLQLADPTRAGLIVPAEQEEHESILMLLMPMMVN